LHRLVAGTRSSRQMPGRPANRHEEWRVKAKHATVRAD
jgi:hypothetical protein